MMEWNELFIYLSKFNSSRSRILWLTYLVSIYLQTNLRILLNFYRYELVKLPTWRVEKNSQSDFHKMLIKLLYLRSKSW